MVVWCGFEEGAVEQKSEEPKLTRARGCQFYFWRHPKMRLAKVSDPHTKSQSADHYYLLIGGALFWGVDIFNSLKLERGVIFISSSQVILPNSLLPILLPYMGSSVCLCSLVIV